MKKVVSGQMDKQVFMAQRSRSIPSENINDASFHPSQNRDEMGPSLLKSWPEIEIKRGFCILACT